MSLTNRGSPLLSQRHFILFFHSEKELTDTLDYDEMISLFKPKPAVLHCDAVVCSFLYELCFLMIAVIFEMGPAGEAYIVFLAEGLWME